MKCLHYYIKDVRQSKYFKFKSMKKSQFPLFTGRRPGSSWCYESSYFLARDLNQCNASPHWEALDSGNVSKSLVSTMPCIAFNQFIVMYYGMHCFRKPISITLDFQMRNRQKKGLIVFKKKKKEIIHVLTWKTFDTRYQKIKRFTQIIFSEITYI